ncbi:RNA methyltransferase [Candidatus Berkelbacteria bacterium]|nr:RNA methyltransferase [Candidatus Berkelbacteria bacterium]
MRAERRQKIERVASQRQAGLTLVLEDIHDPHNAAAILRTADAFGIQTVHFVFNQEAPYNPRRVGKSSSSSANLWLDFVRHASIDDCVAALKADGDQLVATALTDKAMDLYTADLSAERIAILLGNEHAGLSPRALELADTVVQLPMRGFVQSLNVSVTAALVIAEVTRQRRPNMERYLLNKAEQTALVSAWLERRGGRDGNNGVRTT